MADKNRNEKTSNTGFTWSDDELELLLECALQYKSTCEFEGISWESTRAKYEKIKDIIRDRYPIEEGQESENRRDGITKERIAAKIKKIRADYKKAVDAGRRSGGGRVVLTFYNLCENLWGGSPSVVSVENGLDSSADQTSETTTDATISTVHSDTEIEERLSDIDTGLGDYFMDDNNAGPSTTSLDDLELSSISSSRREKIAKFLQNRKDKKLNHRLSNEAQMLSIAKEDVALKRKMIERMGKFDSEFNESVSKVSKTMEEMGETFRQTMGLLANALNPITSVPMSSSSREKDIH